MAIKIPVASRLKFTPLSSLDGVEFWDIPEFPPIVPQADDKRHVVTDTDRMDLIANRYYGNPAHWWVIALANNLENLPTDLVTGAQLVIPSPRYILQEYLALPGVE